MRRSKNTWPVFLTITLVFLLTTSVVMANATANISKEEAYDIVVQQGLNGTVEGKNIYVMSDPVPANSVIEVWFKDPIVLPDAEGWVFFIDDQPFANWEHDCRYAFVDAETGAYTEIAARMYPKSIEEMEELITVEVPDVPAVEGLVFPQPQKNGHWYAVNAKAYAVIISGGASKYSNYVRYWNDCSYIYKTLVNYYGLPDENIYVLISDGTNPADDRNLWPGSGYDSSPLDLDGDGDNDTQYSATKANISTVFNELATKMDRDSYLFIFTTDHGGDDSGSTDPWDVILNLWGETIRDDQFAAEVNKITDHAGMIIVMEQCHSGGMLDDLAAGVDTYDPPRIMASACRHDESSWAMAPDYLYNEFVYYWTAAVNWAYPGGTAVDADVDNDYMVTADEAYDFAESHDTAGEEPQYTDTSSFGDDLSLYFMTRRCVFETADVKKFKFTIKGKGGHSFGAYVKDDGLEGDIWKVTAKRIRPRPKIKDTATCDGSLDTWSPAASFSYTGPKFKAKAIVKYESGLDTWPARMNVRFKHYSSTDDTQPTKVIQKKPE
jgi:hypothetical protein